MIEEEWKDIAGWEGKHQISNYGRVKTFDYNKQKGRTEISNGTLPQRKSEVHKNKKVSEETRRKMSEAHKGKNNPFYGKHHTEETKHKMSEAQKKHKV